MINFYKNIFSKVIIFFLLSIFLFMSIYIVNEGNKAIILKLGKIVLNSNGFPLEKDPGIHFKIPYINTVKLFDIRLKTLKLKSSRIVTKEKKDVLVDSYIKWKIEDLSKFYKRTSGSYKEAEILLKQKIVDQLRASFGRKTIKELISGKRIDTIYDLQKQTNISIKKIGIKVIDIRIKRIDLPLEVSNAVFERMRSERERIASEHRAKGKSKASLIRALADSKASIIIEKALKKAKKMKGDGEAISLEIYLNSYNKNKDFYYFFRSLEAYKKSFLNSNNLLILDSNNKFFKEIK